MVSCKILNFKKNNDLERDYFKKNFSQVNKLIKRIRKSLITGKDLEIKGLMLDEIIDFNPGLSRIYIFLFQDGLTSIRYGSLKETLEKSLNANIFAIRNNSNFSSFDVKNESSCRIMIEWITEKTMVELGKITQTKFSQNRFEPGITGFELKYGGKSYYYMPSYSILENNLGLNQALNFIIRKTEIGKLTNKISERIEILKERGDYKLFLTKSRSFISYKNKIIPLYRSNVFYPEFSYKKTKEIFLKSADWLAGHIYEDGKFLYYYDCTADSRIDHEHPKRSMDDLYYNEIRHCCAILSLYNAYLQTKNKKYLKPIKPALDFLVSITQEEEISGEVHCYTYYNDKVKLGSIGTALLSMMHYRNATGDKSYDKYIKGYARHILYRMLENGQTIDYYICPPYRNGEKIINPTEQELRDLFMFYYQGEALLGLGVFVNNFDDDNELVAEARRKAVKFFDWVTKGERDRVYKDMFAELTHDAWMMQAIEEWGKMEEFRDPAYLDFVFKNATSLINHMYTRDDSPYIDYDGGYFYTYGQHFYPDGARSEGLIAAWYVAKMAGNKEMADTILNAAKMAARSEYQLFNCDEYIYHHKNQSCSRHTIRFKATRQWIRIDTIQHVACFFAKLYGTKKS